MIRSKIFINFLTYMLIFTVIVSIVSAANFSQNFALRYNPFTGKLDYYATSIPQASNMSIEDLNITGLFNVQSTGSSTFDSVVRFNEDVIFFDNLTLIGGSVINSTLIVQNPTQGIIFYINGSDNNNVGIGTSSPNYLLDVYGTLNASTIRANTYDNLPSLDNSTLWANTSNLIYLTDSTKNVGIGVTTPAHKLHVIGNLNITGSFNATRIEANEILISGVILDDRYEGLSTAWNSGNETYNTTADMINAVNGLVNSTAISRSGTNTILTNIKDLFGIGISNPTAKLHIAGNLTAIGGNFSLGSTSDPTNMTLFSPDGTLFRCGVSDAGVFVCS